MTSTDIALDVISDICHRHGIVNVSEIPFERTELNVEMPRKDFLNLLLDIYVSGFSFAKERKNEKK